MIFLFLAFSLSFQQMTMNFSRSTFNFFLFLSLLVHLALLALPQYWFTHPIEIQKGVVSRYFAVSTRTVDWSYILYVLLQIFILVIITLELPSVWQTNEILWLQLLMAEIPLQALQTDTSNTVESNPNPILVSALVIFFSYSSPHISSTLMSQIDISRVISGAEGSEDSCKN